MKNNSLYIEYLISKLVGTFLDKFVELRVVKVSASRDISNLALSKRSELSTKIVRGIDTISQLYLKSSTNRFRGLFNNILLNNSILPIIRCI